MPKITVFTVVYNNYGHFIPQWVEWMSKQTEKPKLLVVLGKDHGANIEWLKENNIDYVICKSDNMGKLRNAGVKQVKTKWWLYFSVDDELLPHACEEIVKTDADAVSLTFDVIEPNGTIKKECHSPCINTIEELNNWQRCWGGYVAIKENKYLRFDEHVEVPNLTLHFELFKKGLKTVRSKGAIAIHHRWSESHHFRSKNIRKQFVKEIDKIAKELVKEKEKEMKTKKYLVKANENWEKRNLQCNDFKPKKIPKKGEQWEVDGLRLEVLLGNNNCKQAFVEVINQIEEETNKDKPKKTTAKKQPKKVK